MDVIDGHVGNDATPHKFCFWLFIECLSYATFVSNINDRKKYCWLVQQKKTNWVWNFGIKSPWNKNAVYKMSANSVLFQRNHKKLNHLPICFHHRHHPPFCNNHNTLNLNHFISTNTKKFLFYSRNGGTRPKHLKRNTELNWMQKQWLGTLISVITSSDKKLPNSLFCVMSGACRTQFFVAGKETNVEKSLFCNLLWTNFYCFVDKIKCSVGDGDEDVKRLAAKQKLWPT